MNGDEWRNPNPASPDLFFSSVTAAVTIPRRCVSHDTSDSSSLLTTSTQAFWSVPCFPESDIAGSVLAVAIGS